MMNNRIDTVYKVFLSLICVAAIVYLFPREAKFKYEFQKGMPWLHENCIAPFTFSILKSDEEIAVERKDIKKNSQFYFRMDTAVYSKQLHAFRKQLDANWDTTHEKNRRRNWFNKNSDDNNTVEMIKSPKEKAFDRGKELLHAIYDKGIVKIDDNIENKQSDYEITVVKNNVAHELELNELFTLQTAHEFIKEKFLISEYNKNEQSLLGMLNNSITHNVFYDEVFTQKMFNQQLEKLSNSKGIVQKNEKIIDRGDVVAEEKYQKLISLKKEYEQQLGGASNYYFIFFGQLLLISVCVTVLLLFLLLFRKDIYSSNKKTTFIILLIILMTFMASFSVRFEKISIYLLPFCILPIIIRTFFDTRLALYTHLIAILIIGFLAPNGFEFVFMQIITGMIAIFSIIDMQKRSQLFFSAMLIFVSYSFTYLGIAFIHEGEWASIKWINFGWFAGSASLVLFSYPLIYIFEKTFGFLSDVSLMELSDTNSPLLRELASKAPGTFQHSIQVANLAEEAIRVIGGNPLLVRTGALYHDIGKLKNPMFFVENQTMGVNPHDKLDYQQSAKIIIKHVTDGIETAKKNNLPEQLIDFIRTHHGTTKVEYFYRSYIKEFPNEEVDESQFHYPGPIPFSKETAVLMMADAVEASSRSLKKVDENAIQDLVNSIIDGQNDRKQFIDADITFKNISTIKDIFIKKLQNIYHARIEYPK